MYGNEGFSWWLTGIADGESCFILSKIRQSRPTASGEQPTSWRFAWVIALRSDDAETLERVQERVGGTLHVHRKGGTNPQTILSVNRRDALMRLTEHFETYPLQSKKLIDFLIWSRALREWDAAPRVGTGVGGGKGGAPKSRDVHNKMQNYFDELCKRRMYNRGE